jgi:hypothetical protein
MTELKLFEEVIYRGVVYYITYTEYYHSVWITDSIDIGSFPFHDFRPTTIEEIEECVNNGETNTMKHGILIQFLNDAEYW